MANDVTIGIGADSSGAVKGIQEVQTGFGKMASSFEKHRKKIAIGMTAIGGGLTALAATQIKSAQAEAIGIAKLDQALKNVGGSYAATSVAIEKQIAATQRSTNFGDEVQREVLVQLVTVLGDEKKALAALPAVLDASAKSGKSTTTVAESMGRALAGLTNNATSAGVSFEKTEQFGDRLAKVMSAVGGQAQAAADPIIQLGNETGDLGQEFGRALLPALEAILPPITNLIRNVTKWAQENPGLTKTIAVFAAGLGGVLLVIGPLLLILPTLVTSVGILAGVFGALSIAMGPITLIVLGIAAAIAAIILVFKHWDTIVAAFRITLGYLKTKLLEGKLVLLEWARAIAALIPTMRGAVEGIDQQIEATERARDAQVEATDALVQKVADEKAAAEESKTTSTETAEVVVGNNQQIGKSYSMVGEAAETSAKTQLSWGEFVNTHNQRLRTIAINQMLDQRKKEKDIDAQRLKDRADYERKWSNIHQDASVQRIMDNQAEAMAFLEAMQDTRASVEESWGGIRASMDKTTIAWKESGADMGDVVTAWAKLTGDSTDLITQRLINAGITADDIKGVFAKFTAATGKNFLDMASDAQQALNTVGTSMKSLGTVSAMESADYTKDPRFAGRQNEFATSMAQNIQRLPNMSTNEILRIQSTADRRIVEQMDALKKLNPAQYPGEYGFIKNVQLPDLIAAATMFSGAVTGMANGGIVRRPTLAMIGESGPEAVIPLNRSGAGGINVHITVNGDIITEDFEQRVTAAVRDSVLGGGFSGILARS